MGIRYKFMENGSYVAEDVNAVFRDLMTAGVLMYDINTTPVDMETAEVTEPDSRIGLLDLDACKVIAENGVYRVLPGVILLEKGPALVIEAPGHEIEVPVGEKCVVFAHFDPLRNQSRLVCAKEQITSDDVMLAEISADGTICDKRVFAYSRTAPKTANFSQTGTLENVKIDYYVQDFLLHEWDFSYPGFHFVILEVGDSETLGFYVKDNQKTFFNSVLNGPSFAFCKHGGTLQLLVNGNGYNYETNLRVTVL